MSKSGQARVLTLKQQEHVFKVIKEHRHSEKNTAIMQISFKLGLRAQEIALLQCKEIVALDKNFGSANRSFTLLEIMALPAAITKGANALNRSKSKYTRKTLNFKIEDFHAKIKQIEQLAKAGIEIEPTDYYPPIQKRKGKSRDLPMVDSLLRESLMDYVQLRISKNPYLKPTDPLFITQKGGPYSPNTLQEHMSLMLRDWGGIEKSSSHSGRRSLITHIIHKQGKSLKVAQTVAGHKSPTTTVIYDEPPEEEISDALRNLNTAPTKSP